MTNTNAKAARAEAERAETRQTLRSIFPAGSDVPTLVTSVSRSGMSRTIRVLAPVRDKSTPGGIAVRDVSHLVARVLGNKYVPDSGVRVDGAGMDMCFRLVYSLACALYGDTEENRREMSPQDKSRLTRWRNTVGRTDAGYSLSPRQL